MPSPQRSSEHGHGGGNMIQQLSGEIRATTAAMQGLTTELHKYAIELNTLQQRFDNVNNVITSLNGIIRDGNDGGLPGRMSLIEERLEKIVKWQEEQTRQQVEVNRDRDQIARDVVKSKEEVDKANMESAWKLTTAMVVSGFSFLGTIVMAFVMWITKSSK